jgi:hypothetical protein
MQEAVEDFARIAPDAYEIGKMVSKNNGCWITVE